MYIELDYMCEKDKIKYLTCVKCGVQGKTDIHHKDRNHFNNVEDNLERLCKSCHRRAHKGLPRIYTKEMEEIDTLRKAFKAYGRTVKLGINPPA